MPFYGPPGTGTGLTAASQAQQEAGTDVAVGTTPGRQHFHPSAAKLWLKATANSTTIEVSYNITSVADTATGRMTVTIATDFSGVDWAGMVCAEVAAAADAHTQVLDSIPAADTCVIENANPVSGLIDPVAWFLVGYGDFA